MKPINRDHEGAHSSRHEEWLMDEAIRGSFPASDPASSSVPGSIANQRYAEAAAGRSRPSVLAIGASLIAMTAALALPTGNVLAQDKAAYDERSVARFEQQFASLDVDRNAEVSRIEANGNVDFIAAFEDIDINRDGVVSQAELDRFLASRFGAARQK